MKIPGSREMVNDLLIEIGTEELPPVALQDLSDAFSRGIARELEENGICHDQFEQFCTPRRLAVLVRDVATHQVDRSVSRRGPSVAAAFDANGSATNAATGFARSCGVAVEELARERTEKGEWLVYRTMQAGDLTARLVPGMVERVLGELPIAKRMRWGATDAEFVRPIHWICLVLGEEAIPGVVFGITACNTTFGHRFHAPGPLVVSQATLYPSLLRDGGYVEPSFQKRRLSIAAQVTALARENGLEADLPPALLDEVTGLVEWPRALFAAFDREFLSVPAEVLMETMRKNQKFFPLRNGAGVLQANFIAIANIDSKDPEKVRRGNERVIRPRFSDAKFFWEQDLSHPLADLSSRLNTVVFQEKLGSVAEKVERVMRLCRQIAQLIEVRMDLVERAAMLSKCDLVSTMVAEFPTLQGTMGKYYAERGGEDPVVCAALEEQYLPRFAGDNLPTNGCGLTLALADRLDTLVGVFGIGHRPTGAKDPYGLRRASIGALRILIERPFDVDLKTLLGIAEAGFHRTVVAEGTADAVLAYMLDRLIGYYQEKGVERDVVDAVLVTNETVLGQLDQRIRAVQGFRNLPAGHALVAANKRIRNILSKGQGLFDEDTKPNIALFCENAERDLWRRVNLLEENIIHLMSQRDFGGILAKLADLREDIDRFFDEVMVMTDDVVISENRLRLLNHLRGLFLQVADISRLQ